MGKRMGKAPTIILSATHTLVSGKMISVTDQVHIFMHSVKNIQETGKMVENMGRVFLLMVRAILMKVITRMTRGMDRVHIHLQAATFTKEVF